MFSNGRIAKLLNEAHDSKVTRVPCRVHALTVPSSSFPRVARATSLAGCGVVVKACTLAFSYGAESDPVVVVTFLAKLTKTTPHTHVPVPPSYFKTPFVQVPIKAVMDAFTGMPKKSLPHRDNWTWELFRDAAIRPSTT